MVAYPDWKVLAIPGFVDSPTPNSSTTEKVIDAGFAFT
jgi:hypothetical protein